MRTHLLWSTAASALILGCQGQANLASRAEGGTADSIRTETGQSALCLETGQPDAVPRARLWRLSGPQYANTVRSLFQIDVPLDELPVDGVADDGIFRFDTNADQNLVNDRLASIYSDQAARIAEKVVAGIAGSPHACVVQADASDECLERFVRHFGSLAYRRPLSDAEAQRMIGFMKSSAQQFGVGLSVRMMIEAMVQSPHFVYRTELGEASEGPKVPLTQHELASQLAYFVTDAPPDAELIAEADNQTLTPEAVKAHALRLLDKPSARRKMTQFFDQYLLLSNLQAKSKDTEIFPMYTAALKQALQTETATFIEKELFENGGTLETLFSARYSYHNKLLGDVYGSGADSTDFVRTPLPANRMGLLSHGSVLATLSSSEGTSPVHRGVFYYQTLLCQRLPIPPMDAADMADKLKNPSDPNATQREAFEHVKVNSPNCASCHMLFQPMGLSLENFDPIGRYRETEYDKPIDSSVTVTGYGDLDGTYANGLELAAELVKSAPGRECFVRQYGTYAFGRALDNDKERCRIQQLSQRFGEQNLNVQSLLVEFTQDEGFYYRSY